MTAQAPFVRPIRIFYFNDYADQKYVDQLERHLRILQRSNRISTWSRDKIPAGTHEAEAIHSYIREADLILIFVSPSLLASNTYEEFIDQVSQQAQNNTLVIPLLVRPVDGWQDEFYGQVQALPRDGRYLSTLRNLDEGLTGVARDLTHSIESLESSLAQNISWLSTGNQQFQAGNFNQAIGAYEMAIQDNPNHADAYLARGFAYQALSNFERALQDFTRALSLTPDNPSIYVARGDLLLTLNRFEEAISSYQKALQLDTQHLPALAGLGIALSQIGADTEALQIDERILNTKSLDKEIAYSTCLHMGQLLQRLHQTEQATEIYEKALKINPNQVDAYLALGNLFFQEEYYVDALQAFTNVVQRDPRNIAGYEGTLQSYLKLHRLHDALNCCDILISLDANNANYYYQKAEILIQLGDIENARSIYAQALSLGLSQTTPPLSFSTSPPNYPSHSHSTPPPRFREDPVTSPGIPPPDEFAESKTGLSDAQVEIQSIETRTKIIYQFLRDAGFEFQPSSLAVGFVTNSKKYLWRQSFPRGLYVRIFLHKPLDQQTVNAIYAEANRYCNHALIVVNQQPDFSGWAQMNILRMQPGQQCFICLPIDESLIIKGVTNNHTLMTLQHYIDNNMGPGFNPYDDHREVFGLRFFGRQALTDQLLAGLHHRQNLGLFGIQKMGKSSLLHDLEKHADFPLAYVYLNDDDDLSRIYSRITSAWATHGHTRSPNFLWQNPLAQKPLVDTLDFDEAVNNLLSYLLNTGEMKPLLGILFDEIEHIVPKEGEDKKLQLYIHLMDKLRGLQQEYGSLVFLVAGVQPSVGRTNYFWNAQKNPLYQLLIERFLPPMEPDECKIMVQSLGQQVNLSYSKDALTAILELSGSHPYVARQLCSQIYRQPNRPLEVDATLVEEVAQDFIRVPATASYFGSFSDKGLWEELGQTELWGEQVSQINHQILLKLAAVEHDLSETELTTNQDGQQSPATMAAFYALKERSIISSPTNNGFYRITMGLFQDWIRFHYPPIQA